MNDDLLFRHLRLGSLVAALAGCLASGLAGAETAASTPAPSVALPGVDTTSAPAANTIPLARVGNTLITVKDLMQVVRADPKLFTNLGSMEERAKILTKLIETRLVNMAALDKAQLTPDAPYEAREEAVRQLVQQEFTPDPISEEQVAAAYAARRESFGIPTAVRIREIFFPVAPNAEPAVKESVRQQAEAALRRVRAGESLEALAREIAHTQALRDVGGDQGFLPLYAYPYLQQATAGLAEGEMTGVIELPGGYEIVQYLGRREGIQVPYEAVKERLQVEMIAAAREKKRQRFLQDYARQVGVEILRPELAGAWSGSEGKEPAPSN